MRGRLPISEVIPMALLLAVVAVVFLPSLHFGILNWDDEYYITQNAWLLNLSWKNLLGVFRHTYFANYHPLTIFSYMLDFQLWGYNPAGYRAVNILLHAATVCAGYGLARMLGATRWVSFLAMLFFAIHPLRLESVVWLSERKDVLSGLFYVLGLLCWVRGAREDVRARWWIGGALLCLLLSLLSKAMAVSFPVVILLHDVILHREKVKRRMPAHALALAMALAFAWLNMQAQANATAPAMPLAWRLKVAFCAPLHYLLKTVAPVGLSPLYPFEFRPSESLLYLALAAVVNAAAVAAVVWTWRRAPLVAWGLLACAPILVPVSGIISFGGAWAADRYSYLPTLVLLAGVAATWPEMRQRAWAATIALTMCAAMAAVTLSIMPMWKDSRSMWGRVGVIFPGYTRGEIYSAYDPSDAADDGAEAALAVAQTTQQVDAATELVVREKLRGGDAAAALEATKSIVDPSHRAFWRMRIARDEGQWPAASAAARELLALEPPAPPEMRANAAYTLIKAGEKAAGRAALEAIGQPTFPGFVAWSELAELATSPAEAEECALEALDIFPAEPRALRKYGELLLEQNRLIEGEGRFAKAARHRLAEPVVRHYAMALLGRIAEMRGHREHSEALYAEAFRPEQSEAATLNFLGFTAEQVGRLEDAGRLYEETLALEPAHLDAHLNLAFVRLRQKRVKEAVDLLENAHRLHPEDEMVRQNLEAARTQPE